MKKIITIFMLFLSFFLSQNIHAESKLSLMPGGYYNGQFLPDETSGMGLILGLEYMNKQTSFFSIEFRTKYGYYVFDDGTKWTTDDDGYPEPPVRRGEARLEYKMFLPQVCLVPKLWLHLEDVMSLFLENEFSAGIMKGKFEYLGFPDKINITDVIYSYNVGVGVQYPMKKCYFVGSVGCSTLNFRKNIRKHKPLRHNTHIPNQDAAFWINVIFKVRL